MPVEMNIPESDNAVEQIEITEEQAIGQESLPHKKLSTDKLHVEVPHHIEETKIVEKSPIIEEEEMKQIEKVTEQDHESVNAEQQEGIES